MTGEPIDYLELTRKALRGVMADSLSHAVENELVEGQHFYITFMTTLRGVVIPDWLQSQYPEEMTIVLQHEFWDLAVMKDRFTVGLSFSGRNVTLVVPFAAVKTFADPSVNFQLDIPPGGLEQEEASQQLANSGEVADKEEPAMKTEEETASEQPKEATVVSLDAFRKK